jgi:hypothetical protein
MWLDMEKLALATRRRLEARPSEWLGLGQSSRGILDEIELPEAEHCLSSAMCETPFYSLCVLSSSDKLSVMTTPRRHL